MTAFLLPNQTSTASEVVSIQFNQNCFHWNLSCPKKNRLRRTKTFNGHSDDGNSVAKSDKRSKKSLIRLCLLFNVSKNLTLLDFGERKQKTNMVNAKCQIRQERQVNLDSGSPLHILKQKGKPQRKIYCE